MNQRKQPEDLMQNKLVVALAGNPNAGKTTIFNALTGARQHVWELAWSNRRKKRRIFKTQRT
jgi:ferrous iron transport protein B